jgi:hypothetical protein
MFVTSSNKHNISEKKKLLESCPLEEGKPGEISLYSAGSVAGGAVVLFRQAVLYLFVFTNFGSAAANETTRKVIIFFGEVTAGNILIKSCVESDRKRTVNSISLERGV